MLLSWLLALSPILLILLLMTRYRWGAAKAGLSGLILATLIGIFRFGAGLELLAFSQVKALLLTLDVLLIIWSAFLLYRVVDEAGAIAIIGKGLPHLTGDRGMQALIIGWAFASFLQGVGGFGVPVAVIAPIMVGLGFSPLMAVIVPSIGHGWSVTFGSLASSFQALIAASGLPGQDLAAPAAIMLGFAGVITGFMVLHSADGMSAVRRLAFPATVMAVGMVATQFILATNGLWNIGGFGGGMAGLLIGILLARRYRGMEDENGQGLPSRSELLLSISGYLILVTITLAVQLIPSVREMLGSIVIRVPFPEIATSLGFVTPAEYGRQIPILRHAGTILFVTALISYLVYRRAGMYLKGASSRIVKGTVRRVMSSSLGIAAMVTMAVVMSHSGMTDLLASGMAEEVGVFYPIVSPWIGALGAFMTGSNTNSNVVFAMLQLRTATILGLSGPIILAAQTAGGAVGSVIAPTKIVVGASTAGLTGNEGDVLRRMLGYMVAMLVALSVMEAILLKVWP